MSERTYPCIGYEVSFSRYNMDEGVSENWPMIDPVMIHKETEKSFTVSLIGKYGASPGQLSNKRCVHKNTAKNNDYTYVYTLEEAKQIANTKLTERESVLEAALDGVISNMDWIENYQGYKQ